MDLINRVRMRACYRLHEATQYEECSRLIRAARGSAPVAVRRWLGRHWRRNTAFPGTLLMKAADTGRLSVVRWVLTVVSAELILDVGFEPSTSRLGGHTALGYALQRRHEHVVRYLLEQGALVSVYSFYLACVHGCSCELKRLLFRELVMLTLHLREPSGVEYECIRSFSGGYSSVRRITEDHARLQCFQRMLWWVDLTTAKSLLLHGVTVRYAHYRGRGRYAQATQLKRFAADVLQFHDHGLLAQVFGCGIYGHHIAPRFTTSSVASYDRFVRVQQADGSWSPGTLQLCSGYCRTTATPALRRSKRLPRNYLYTLRGSAMYAVRLRLVQFVTFEPQCIRRLRAALPKLQAVCDLLEAGGGGSSPGIQ